MKYIGHQNYFLQADEEQDNDDDTDDDLDDAKDNLPNGQASTESAQIPDQDTLISTPDKNKLLEN
jgi:hypothetical protein